MVTSSELLKAARDRQLVRFSRRFEDDTVRGYIIGVGPVFFLILLVSDRIWFDGFECFRATDVRGFEADPYARFAETALRKRGERRPKSPRIDLGTIEGLLLTANRNFPLVTIHCERLDPEVCYIGRVVGVERGRVSLLEIQPGAVWDSIPSAYGLKDITRVGFGGDYEDALSIVGGEPYLCSRC
jgi:hypothetical protein